MDECFLNETSDPANLTNSQRGNLAELAFMRKAASLGLSVAKPWNEGERYDFIVRIEHVCWRVQVKSVLASSPSRRHDRIKTAGGDRHQGHTWYSANEIDFLVAYIFPHDAWYIFPAIRFERRTSICVTPGSKRSSFEQYREAWKLMKPPRREAALNSAPEPVAETEVKTEVKTMINP